jgi:ribosomal protein S8
MNIFANFICSLKTACLNKVLSFVVKKNKKVIYLCLILEELGYISGFTILNSNYIKVNLKYYKNKSVIRTLNLFSKPSSRIYLKKKNIFGFRINSFIKNNNFTLFSSSFSKFFLTDIEMIMLGIGGEPVIVIG